MSAYYPHKPIASIESLAKTLDVTEAELLEVAQNSDSLFFVAKCVKKENGKVRVTYDARPALKNIHDRIKIALFRVVKYPFYLQGGISGRDYISNTKIHAGKKFLITEDVSNFFPSIQDSVVKKMWLYFFHFSPEVADVLTKLTTHNGFVPQGAKTSGYIANLILWDKEPVLVEYLRKKGMSYSRLVDDITISCDYKPSKKLLASMISDVYGMLLSKDVKPNRGKHKIMTQGEKQRIHNLNVDKGRPSLPKSKRADIRAAVFQCEEMAKYGRKTEEYNKLFNSTVGRVATMKRLHPTQATILRNRLDMIKPKK
ncbi:reverse transcriptase family protein [Thiothrix lacustris]|uniref:reverse transcriptase family protein n=1 Tax=Thiothrix lacustris TaxID=525917 RepID=UPI000AFAA02D|nr:reverse transcriptase family protein [Thiothrix lacustris]